MASKTQVKYPVAHVNTYVLLYKVQGKWLLRFYTDLTEAIREKEKIKRTHTGTSKTRVYIAWILV